MASLHSALAALPGAGTPFPDEQFARIEALLREANAEQVIWLRGYLAGIGAAAPRAAAAPSPATRAALTILYATESGNAEALAAAARKSAQKQGFAVTLRDMADATLPDVAKAERLLVIAATWGEGDPPQRAEAFYAALMAADAPRFAGTQFSVLALGDRAYASFCETGRRIDARLAELGARRASALVECDLDYAAPARGWTEAALAALAPEAEVIRVDFARAPAADDTRDAALVAEAEIAERVRLSSSRSSAETWHVELSLAGTGLSYQPGDAIGIAPRNDPALVEAVLAATGNEGDAALAEALTDRYDITTLTAAQIEARAAQTGDAALAAFPRDRHLIDLLEAAPARLAPEALTALLRPLPPRLYSVASAPEAVGEAAHLLIAAVRWESHGRARKGVASIDVTERRGPGERLAVHVKPNPHFRLPEDRERPIVMIGPGTGVAPFRGFLQRR
ncbi:MAG: flavodoxin domain-containing protein, partial [Rhodospirillales bacterium]|nr:flavodoxin domain-containing protein [Rhodospirillales bacterium]